MLHFGCNYVYVNKKWADEKEDIVYNDDVTDDYDTSASGLPKKRVKAKSTKFDDGESCLLDILDTAGQEEYSVIRDSYMRNADGLLLVYDVTDGNSLDEAEQCYEWSLRVNSVTQIPAILCANKIDLPVDGHAVTRHQGVEIARRRNLGFIETSAKTGHNVSDAFTELVKLIPRTGVEYKIVVVGAGCVGKSSITIRYTTGHFMEQYDPTIEDSYRKMITIPGLKDLHKTRPPVQSQHATDSKAKLSTFGKIKRALSFKKKSSKDDAGSRDISTSGTQQVLPGRKVKTRKVECEKATGNAFLLTLGNLEQEKPLVTGDPIRCKQCESVLCQVTDPCTDLSQPISKLSYEEGFAKWTCEFCGTGNQTEAEKSTTTEFEGRLPSMAVVEYMLEPPQAREQRSTKGMVVYCIDVSSSMTDRKSVPTSLAQWKSVKSGCSETRDTVTCMEGVQGAVCRQLERLKIEQPEKQVVIVTFASDVCIYGNNNVKTTVSGSDLNNYDSLVEQGRKLFNDLNVPPLSSAYSTIYELVKSLVPNGCTALGPALAVCCGMVSAVPCSEVVLCTDGEPNSGVGNLQKGAADFDARFYKQIGHYAKENDTKISIIGLEGADMSMSRIEEAAKITSGSIHIMHPLELIRELRLISQNPVIATDVDISVFMHPVVRFQEHTIQHLVNCMTQHVGNATKCSDLSFQFQVNNDYKDAVPSSIPFQVHINYIKSDGSRFVRVISTQQECTADRGTMEQGVNVAILSLASVHTTAKLAQARDFQNARNQLHATRNLLERGATTVKQKEEFYANLAESESLDDELRRQLNPKYNYERAVMSDSAANVLSSHQNANLSKYLNAADKREMCEARTTTAQLSDQYYDYAYDDAGCS